MVHLSLLDPNFSNDDTDTDGFGRVWATSDSLAISVEDDDNETVVIATATLLLKSSGTIEFHNYALPPLMIELLTPLHIIYQFFPHNLNGDDDTVVIHHLTGTDRLQFEFGTDVPRPSIIWTETYEIPCVKMFPYLTVLSAITVPVNDISDMCDYILPEEDPSNDKVFVDWKEGVATFQIGSVKKWAYDYSQNERTFHGWFNWKYTTFMKEASFLADKVRVLFLTVPEQHVLFQFHIGEAESADLFLLQKARLVIPDMSAEEGAREEDVSDSVTLDTLSNSWLH